MSTPRERSATDALSLYVVVPGVPQSKGSRTQVARGRNIEAGTTRSRARKRRSAASIKNRTLAAIKKARLPRESLPLTCPVRIDAYFFFPIARSRLRGKRAIEPGSPHTQKPDRDKCVRHVNDPLTKSGLIADDCIDAMGWSEKRWCLPGEERTEIRIRW